jgi:hypothetical protein
MHPEATYLALEASKAAFSSASFILLKILKQYLKVAMAESAELESLSVKVHRYLTCYFRRK